jgi:hypothetical protein
MAYDLFHLGLIIGDRLASVVYYLYLGACLNGIDVALLLVFFDGMNVGFETRDSG